MSTTVRNGLVNAEEAQVNKIKPNSGTSVTIQDADGNDRLTVDGDGVTIAGTTTTVDVATVTVDDKNVEINAVASPTDANADGGGLTLKGSTDKTILWENDDDSWHFNQGVVVAGTAHATLVEGSLSQGNIQVGVDSGGDPGGELMFHTDDYVGLRCANSGAVSLAVKPSGNVGIGTTEPAVALDVIGTGSFAGAAASLSQGNVQVGVDSGGDAGGELMFHTDDYVGLRCAHSGALPFAVKPSGNVGIGDVAPGTQLQMSGTAPYVTLKNSTAENTAGGCESKIIFEDHADVTLAQVEGSHSGSSDDTKGKLILSTHTGSALTAALTIDDGQDAAFAGDVTTEGSVLLKEKAAAIADVAAYGQLWTKSESPCELYFTTDAGDDIQITDGTAIASSGSSSSRYTVSNRFRARSLADGDVHFTKEVDAAAELFYMTTTYKATSASTIAVDANWLSGAWAGPQWHAPRACTLTQIAATARIQASTDCHSLMVRVFKGTPVNNEAQYDDITITLIGTAILTLDGSTELTDSNLFHVNQAISSDNSISAGDVLLIGLEPDGGATTSSDTFLGVTLEMTTA